MTIRFAKFAVAIIVLRQKNEAWETLLVARKDDHTRWSLPGGKLDLGETASKAAVRELLEETSFTCQPGQLVEQETVLDSGGYLTTFYLFVGTDKLPSDKDLELHNTQGEAPVRWGPVTDLFSGPFGNENRERFRKMGIIP